MRNIQKVNRYQQITVVHIEQVARIVIIVVIIKQHQQIMIKVNNRRNTKITITIL